MNKLIAIMILLIVIAMSVVIITSENANVPVKYDKPLAIEKVNNTTFIDYSNYYVEEKVINGVNEIWFAKNSSYIKLIYPILDIYTRSMASWLSLDNIL